ncbi:uncharacterized protein LOC125003847 isoform X1 [Mugil cephalus]|uniref:uncharacterized protein LOC125003847 isoform X1 n=1 Tax=Mugil cephalus TaxID=48193 RepID=UPI001FB85C10|nr:uncharacterized protein LOC125003847 isoform X1 [Mugil cephalus]
MFLVEAGCLIMTLILNISGVQGKPTSICALKGSSVTLSCSGQRHTANKRWYIVNLSGSMYVPTEISTDGNQGKYSVSEESNFTLTINDLKEDDTNYYCCTETNKLDNCSQNTIYLHVSDLQVKVIPATEGQTVTLMCSTSCPRTENLAAYIWYKNREFLYEDWSPWYQELVSSEEAVTYSCAVKGYEDLRAPEVSVDSVTPTCFSVTYAKGRMCSYQQTSVDESCSITYPREIHVQRIPTDKPGYIRLTCNTSCLHTDNLTSFMWFKNRQVDRNKEKQQVSVLKTATERLSCAVKGLEDLRSADVCVEEKKCLRVNYISRSICALKGSSVNISSEYSHPDNQQSQSKLWYKVKRNTEEENQQLTGETHDVKFHDNMKNQHILTLNNLKKKDSAEYIFTIKTNYEQVSGSPGVSLVVTDLKVKISPSPVVTEGQRVSLTCRTSCPLPANTNYIWYFNNRPLNLIHDQSKHLLLDPVSSQDAGNYSCAVTTNRDINSALKTLTVQTKQTSKLNPAAAAGVSVALLVLLPLTVFLWIRKKRTSSRSPVNETLDNLEQINCGDDDSSAQPAEQELLYSRIHFSEDNTDPLYSLANPPQSQDQEMVPYAAVKFRSNSTSELNDQTEDT